MTRGTGDRIMGCAWHSMASHTHHITHRRHRIIESCRIIIFIIKYPLFVRFSLIFVIALVSSFCFGLPFFFLKLSMCMYLAVFAFGFV